MRPRDGAPQVTMYWDALDRSLVAPDGGGFDADLDGQRRTRDASRAVSYTHLTLPTILLV